MHGEVKDFRGESSPPKSPGKNTAMDFGRSGRNIKKYTRTEQDILEDKNSWV